MVESCKPIITSYVTQIVRFWLKVFEVVFRNCKWKFCTARDMSRAIHGVTIEPRPSKVSKIHVPVLRLLVLIPDVCSPSQKAKTNTRTPGDDEKDGNGSLKVPGPRRALVTISKLLKNRNHEASEFMWLAQGVFDFELKWTGNPSFLKKGSFDIRESIDNAKRQNGNYLWQWTAIVIHGC